MKPALEIGKRFNPYKLFTGAYIPNSLMESREFTSTEKLAWARLAQLSKGHDGIEATHAMIAVGIGIADQSVPAVIKGLVDKGLIQKVLPTGQDRLDHKPVSYYFLWHPIFATALRADTDAAAGSDTDCGQGAGADSIQYKRIKKENNTESTPFPPTGGDAADASQDRIDWQSFATRWNENVAAKCPKIPSVLRMTPKRKEHLGVRLKDKAFDFDAICKKVLASPFLRGETSEWVVTFDWVIANDSNYIKVLEGKYNEVKPVDDEPHYVEYKAEPEEERKPYKGPSVARVLEEMRLNGGKPLSAERWEELRRERYPDDK